LLALHPSVANTGSDRIIIHSRRYLYESARRKR
jgi:hypothetical protein